ncbi:MAG: hypothetical protein NT130_05455 [Candidatus Micrarchaeota archaeon]|nr:hypothetical protein [Candidatus Micrarchaeota archaeon]
MVCFASIAYADISPVAGWIEGAFYLAALLVAMAMTLGVELVTSFIYLHLKKISKWVLLSVILANILSVPVLWIFVAVVGSDMTSFLLALLFGEVVVFVFEAALIFLMNKKRIKLNDAVVMSLINNLASLILGVVLIAVRFVL